jgi:hypothetical protein
MINKSSKNRTLVQFSVVPIVRRVLSGCGRGARTPHKAQCALLFVALLATSLPLHAQSTTGIYVNPGNNVGIGTTSPQGKLHISGGPSLASGTDVLHLEDPTGASGHNKFAFLLRNYQSDDFGIYDAANSAYRLYIGGNGNIGIGTTNPSYRLDANGVIHSTVGGGSNIVLSKTNGASMAFDNNAGVQTALIESGSPANANRLEFWTNTANNTGIVERMLIDNSGRVGIGTTNPANRLVISDGPSTRSQLTISDTNSCSLMLRAGASQQSVLASDVGLSIRTGASWTNADAGGTTAMSLLTNGNVGIGTTNPVAILHIHGNYNNDGSGGFLLDATDDGDPEKYSLRINPFVVGGAEVGYQFQTKSSSGGTNVPLTFDHAGNVGIDTMNPGAPLDVSGFLHVSGNTSPSLYAQGGYVGWNALSGGTGEMDFMNQEGGGSGGFAFFNSNDTTSGRAIVTIDGSGSIFANEFIAASGNVYPDFVFKPGYKVPSLSETEASIKKEGHLPGIPSEAEAKAHGINLAQMQVNLLQKIEELTLHQIEQEKRLNEQSKDIEQLRKENTELRERLTK